MEADRRSTLARSARGLALGLASSLAMLAGCGGSDPSPAPQPPNQPPTATIASPADGATFRAGDRLSVTVRGDDAEDGPLAGEQLTWWIELHHDTHTHPFQPETHSAGAAIDLPRRGETSSKVFYRLHLRATDSSGATSSEVTRDLLPLKSDMSFATLPEGLQLALDGQPLATPTRVTGVVGVERDIAAPDQALAGRRYRFESWSDGGAATHTITTPGMASRYTATFVDIGPVENQPPDSIALGGAETGTAGVPLTLTADARDDDDGIAKVEWLLGTTVLGTDTTAPYAFAWTPETAGEYSLVARATDAGGLTRTSAPLVITIAPATAEDREPPSITLRAPAAASAGLTGTVELSADAADNVGVTAVEFQVDGEATGDADIAAPYEGSVDTSRYASGQHVVRARARDAAGNWSTWATATVSFGGTRYTQPGFVHQNAWVTGLSGATRMAQAPDGRMFVAEQTGALRVVKNGALLPTPFVTLPVHSVGEHGLVGVALHPAFATNGWVYVYYTTAEGGVHNRISRLTANGDVAAPGSEVRLVDLPPLVAEIHDAGSMVFGQDGKLYVGVGENAVPSNAQDLSTPLGKLLRLNEDGSIPPDNPFCSRAEIACGVWARGLRNPFTLSLEPGTGRIFIGDVGQGTWEEIDLAASGANYGWPGSEGPDNVGAGITAPLFTYRHSATTPPGTGPGGFFTGYAIGGGAFYPSTATLFPLAFRNSFYFVDYVTRFIGRLDLANGNAAYAFGQLAGPPVGVHTGNDGALYVLTRTNIIRIAPQ